MLGEVMWAGASRPGVRVFVALLPILLLLMALVAIVILVRQAGRRNAPFVTPPPPPPGFFPGTPAPPVTTSNPLQVLDERLARGEIDEADYQSRRALLLQNQGG